MPQDWGREGTNPLASFHPPSPHLFNSVWLRLCFPPLCHSPLPALSLEQRYPRSSPQVSPNSVILSFVGLLHHRITCQESQRGTAYIVLSVLSCLGGLWACLWGTVLIKMIDLEKDPAHCGWDHSLVRRSRTVRVRNSEGAPGSK